MKKIFINVTLVFATLTISAQTKKSEGNFNFTKYPAKIQKINNKASLENLSNPLTKSYSTASKEQYKNSKINFAGHYILIENGDGYESNAVIADVKTGKIYNIPENKEPFSANFTFQCLNQQPLIYKSNSNLLVINNFEGGESEKPIRNYYVWNDTTKKFKKIKSETLKCQKTD